LEHVALRSLGFGEKNLKFGSVGGLDFARSGNSNNFRITSLFTINRK
jgi:hypothetical protein